MAFVCIIPFEVRYSLRSNSSLFINYYQVCLINIRIFNNLSSDIIISKLSKLLVCQIRLIRVTLVSYLAVKITNS